jgi:hypothetical protein
VGQAEINAKVSIWTWYRPLGAQKHLGRTRGLLGRRSHSPVKTMRGGLGVYEENGSSEVGKVTSQDKIEKTTEIILRRFNWLGVRQWGDPR